MTTRERYTGYKGWPNYETWLVNCWLTTEPHCYERLMAIVQNPDTLGEQSTELSEWVRPDEGEDEDADAIEQTIGITGMYVDLLAAAFDKVEWKEIIRTNQSGPYEGQR
jgi:hypothetical protein